MLDWLDNTNYKAYVNTAWAFCQEINWNLLTKIVVVNWTECDILVSR